MTATSVRGVPVTRTRGPVIRALARPELGAVVAAVVIAIYFTTRTDQFASAAGLGLVLAATSTLGIMAVAVALLMIGGEFDLSAGALTGSTGLVAALLVETLQVNLWEGIVWALVFALLVGFVNGLLVTMTGLPGFIVTLGTLFALTGANVGVTQLVTDTVRVDEVDRAAGYDVAHAVFASQLSFGGGEFAVAIAWWLGLTVLATLLLVRTKFGNWIFGAGGDAASARSAGVPVRRTKILLFMGTASAAWLVGTISLVSVRSVSADAALGEEFTYIIAAVIGGCLITGGAGSALGAALGALIYGMTQQGIVFAGWNSAWFPLVIGVMLLIAVLINTTRPRRVGL